MGNSPSKLYEEAGGAYSSIWENDEAELYAKAVCNSQFFQDIMADLQNPDKARAPTPYEDWIQEPELLRSLDILETNDRAALSQPIAMDDDHIHSIFARSNWDHPVIPGIDMPKMIGQAYENMRPALALATRFMTHEQYSGWWIHVLYGKSNTDSKTNKIYLRERRREQNLKHARNAVAEKMTEMSTKLRLFWSHMSPMTGTSYCNKTSAVGTLRNSAPKQTTTTKAPLVFSPLISISMMFLYHLLSPKGAFHRSEASNLRLQLSIANTLLHEVAHIYYATCQGVEFGFNECYTYLSDNMPEAGFSWENFAFSSDLFCQHMTRHGLGFITSRTFQDMHSTPQMTIPITMTWISQWFEAATWERMGSSLTRLSMQPPRLENLPMKYPGILSVERYSSERKTWYRLLYLDGKPCACAQVVPIAGANVDAQRHANTKFSSISPECTVKEWFDQVRKSDIEKAVQDGFLASMFPSGRHRYYIRQCYDGDGT